MRKRVTLPTLTAVGLCMGIAAATAQSQPAAGGLGGYPVLPRPEAPFRGTIGPTVKDSTA